MKPFPLIRATAVSLLCLAAAGIAAAASIDESIDNDMRNEANRERDGDRKPDQVLAFIDLQPGDVVLDYGSGGGYWAELFSGVVGEDGMVYAHQNSGERFESQKAALMEQYSNFDNVGLLPVDRGAKLPLDDDSVDTVFLSYLFHHMHYADGSGENFPDTSTALVEEFSRVLKPGGTFIIIEHAAADGSSREQSAAWHRTPPETAKEDITNMGFEFDGDAPEIFHNPDDDMMNSWGETGLRGNTTTFVHKYRLPE